MTGTRPATCSTTAATTELSSSSVIVALLTGGAQGEDGVGAVLQVEIDKALECVKVDTAILFKRRDEGDGWALELRMFMFFSFASAICGCVVPLSCDCQALVLGATAGAFGARFGQQLSAARQHVERGKVIAGSSARRMRSAEPSGRK